ncbi:LOW QUALITY PROTEIN: chaperone protein ClpC2, chloroplastic [Jatropha curcas]|uniref:LOW QUALITY PROTEIN: chaperone protein ClpC2, chloroplastic n=1 Tax=Jatropha curcas TaxID=180498 RepID=UPI0009D6CE31|nr:LOW QUALITY PROTEIN: chaperone protein ClpC2, chloroplastic [Jatropha curcas]
MRDECVMDLTEMAEEGLLDTLIGRQDEIERVMQILCKTRKNNPCLIGVPGVGKTVIVRGLANQIATSIVPPELVEKRVLALDLRQMIVGTSNTDEFERTLIEAVDGCGKARNIVLFISELHTLVAAGAGSKAGDGANILKEAIERGGLQCIVETTPQEYREYIEKDRSFKRCFQNVHIISEPSIEEAIEILKAMCPKHEAHHKVTYETDALVAAVRLSKKYTRDRFLPDSAIDLIDEAGARFQLQKLKLPLSEPVITVKDIKHVISMGTGIAVEVLNMN